MLLPYIKTLIQIILFIEDIQRIPGDCDNFENNHGSLKKNIKYFEENET